MRPNSLFFDRGGKTSFARAVSMLITVVFLVLIGFVIIRYKYFTYIIREELLTTPLFGWILVAYVLLFAIFALVIRWTNCHVRRMPAYWALAIFLLALAPRLYFYAQISYVPTSDFANYYQMGVSFVNGDFAQIAKFAADYHISSFSGLGVLNGLIMTVFGTSVRSFQLVQSVITSLSSVLIYLIARRFDEGSAPAAGLLFALYPANIIFSQVTSNQHLAVLLALTSILLALIAFSSPRRVRAGVTAALSGLAMLLSFFAHPSAATTLLAFGLFWAILFFSSLRNRKELLRLAIVALAFCAAFFGLRAGANAGMRVAGLSQSGGADSSMLAKVVIGLNPETAGGYSESDWGMIWRQPENEQNAFSIKVIRERLAQDDLFGLFDLKLMRMWMVKDGQPEHGVCGDTFLSEEYDGLYQSVYTDGLLLCRGAVPLCMDRRVAAAARGRGGSAAADPAWLDGRTSFDRNSNAIPLLRHAVSDDICRIRFFLPYSARSGRRKTKARLSACIRAKPVSGRFRLRNQRRKTRSAFSPRWMRHLSLLTKGRPAA